MTQTSKTNKGKYKKHLQLLKQLATADGAINANDLLNDLDIIFAGYLQSEIHDITNRDPRADMYMSFTHARDALAVLLKA